MKNLRFLVFVSLCLTACRPYVSPVPDVPVYLERNLAIIRCQSPGDYCEFKRPQVVSDRVGYGGVLLVCAFDSRYYAFDLCCPVEAQAGIGVGCPDETLLVRCPACGEVYDLGFGLGIPTLGVSSDPLKRYRVNLSADGNILIQN